MLTTAFERRDELTAERAALMRSLEGLKSLFIATLADELPKRWELATGAWLESREGRHISRPTPQWEAETLHTMARDAAYSFLEAEGIWGHEQSDDSLRAVAAYAPTGTGSQWSHVSPAIAEAEYEAIRRVDTGAAPTLGRNCEYEFGSLSEPLEQLLYAYSVAFTQLQKVCIALARVSTQLPRPRPNLTSARG